MNGFQEQAAGNKAPASMTNGLSIPGALLVFTLIVVMFGVWWSFFAVNKVQTFRVLYNSGPFSINGVTQAESAGLRAQPTVAAGSVFETGAEGYATLRTSDGSTLQLMPKTQLEIVDAKTNGRGDYFVTALRMLSGELLSRIAREDGRGRDVNLYSKSVAIGVRGTVFNVSDMANVARLVVTEGKVAANGQRGAGILVKQGKGTVIHAGMAPEPTSVLLSAPQLQIPTPGDSAGKGGLNLAWQVLEGATGYLVEVAQDAAFNRLLRRQWVSWHKGALGLLKQDGNYFWRVAGIDKRGLRGQFSAGRPLQHDAYYRRSKAALANLQVGAVLKNLDRAAKGLKAEINALRDQGFNALNTGRYARAKEIFAVVLQLLPKDRLAQNGLGQADYHLLDYDSARRRYSDSLGAGPEGVDAEVGLALIDVREGKFKQALRRINEILLRDPVHSGALNVAAMASLGLGKAQQALQFITRVLSIDNENSTALDLQRSIQGLAAPTLELPETGKLALPEAMLRKLQNGASSRHDDGE